MSEAGEAAAVAEQVEAGGAEEDLAGQVGAGEAEEDAAGQGRFEEGETGALAGTGEDELLGFVQVDFVEVRVELPSTNPVVVLEEVDPPKRRLTIPVGQAEGVAIAYAARRIPTPRPLTHELFVSALEAFGLSLEHVRVTEVHKTSFSAELVLSGPWGTRTLACRPSDGIALALRQQLGAPIVVAPEVLDEAGELPSGR